MKKILLLFAIFMSTVTLSAQSIRYVTDARHSKNSQVSSSFASADSFIESISVYPNPVTDVLKIAFKSSHRTIATISLFNNIGKQIYCEDSEIEPGNNIISIEIRSKAIDPGIYFVQCVAENEIFTRKLIVK